jgi:hypothetical protein
MNSAQNVCIECGKDITFKRSDAKYCSDRCRMQFQRSIEKMNLLWELYEICTSNPQDTKTKEDGELYIKLPSAYRRSQEMVNIKDLKNMSIDKIRTLIKEKRKEINNQKVIDGIIGLLNR